MNHPPPPCRNPKRVLPLAPLYLDRNMVPDLDIEKLPDETIDNWLDRCYKLSGYFKLGKTST